MLLRLRSISATLIRWSSCSAEHAARVETGRRACLPVLRHSCVCGHFGARCAAGADVGIIVIQGLPQPKMLYSMSGKHRNGRSPRRTR